MGRVRCSRYGVAGVVAAAVFVSVAGVAGAHSASVCSADGVNTAAVKKTYAVIADIVQLDGVYYCELETKYGDVNIFPNAASYSSSFVAEFKDSYSPFKKEAPTGLGKGALMLWGPASPPEQETQVGFIKGTNFWVLSSMDEPLHNKLLSLARLVYAHLP